MNPSAATRTTWQNPVDVLIPVDAERAARDGCELADDVLLQICGLPTDDPQVTPEWVSRVRLVTRLLGDRFLCPPARVEAAMTLLASALGQLTQLNPTHLPFGYGGQEVRSHGWMERRVLERAGKQIVGLMWRHTAAEAVAVVVERAVSESIRLGFLEQRQYDAWRPGMRSGSGWRWAVMATPYGVARAALLANDADGQDLLAREPQAKTEEGDADHPDASVDSANAADIPAPADVLEWSNDHTDPEKRPRQQGAESSLPSDDRYEWARQIDLVRATNQVLGEGMLNKGVLSRACADGHVVINGKTGRGARVSVRSFLTWVSRQNELSADETNQIRNAVIGEISSRNS